MPIEPLYSSGVPSLTRRPISEPVFESPLRFDRHQIYEERKSRRATALRLACGYCRPCGGNGGTSLKRPSYFIRLDGAALVEFTPVAPASLLRFGLIAVAGSTR